MPYSNNKSLKNRLLLAISTFFLAVIMSGFAPGLAQEEKKIIAWKISPAMSMSMELELLASLAATVPLARKKESSRFSPASTMPMGAEILTHLNFT
ncbi:MAG: hypothetical protein IPJ49_22660 [Candidatus Obscuribacter sp.]|nr:hypothetical protein [Candidatus Obscuribacter sp.]